MATRKKKQTTTNLVRQRAILLAAADRAALVTFLVAVAALEIFSLICFPLLVVEEVAAERLPKVKILTSA